ncbi:protein kinase domain-containing protein [Streptomyces sp. OR43]|uniref:protein kinase domain-containing protein n=1 Tax=Streptomyces sp. or43 TaxID=2478957 RepID=UPI0011CD4638|nr:protein kinase [Streptomyces sp. or43]TXS38304.1 serine/threonine protein kinase [Streptomyces sp. or43]
MNSATHHIGPDATPDRYRLLNSIGRGGEAVLYRAEIELDGAPETVVVKVLDSKTTITIEQFQRLSAKWQEQAELLRFVNRPGVVGVREHFEGPPIHGAGDASTAAGRALVLVMNHVDGLDLRDWRAERTLAGHAERREVLRTLEQLADVLDWLHSGRATPSGRTVVHGDLSPGNVMVDGHGQATLVDFGLSKLTADHQTAEVWFTPGYAAPEVFEGKRTPNTDRYAFGAIAYFLLSGQAPPSTPEQLRAALRALPQVAAATPERCERILSVCAAEPDGRPESLSAWVKDVRSAVVSTTVTGSSVRPAPPAESLRDTPPAAVPAAVPPPPLLPPGNPAGPGSPAAPGSPAGPGGPARSGIPAGPGSPVAPPGRPDAQPAFPPPVTASSDPGVPLPTTVNPGPSQPAPSGPASPGPVPAQSLRQDSPFPTKQDGAAQAVPAPKKRRPVLVPLLSLALVAALATIGVQALRAGDDEKGDDKGAKATPTVTVTTTEPAAQPDGSETTPSGSPEASDGTGTPPEAAESDTKSLTTLDPVATGQYAALAVGNGTLNSKYYDTALVPDGGDAGCNGSAEYNLSREWKTLTMLAGVDDNSSNKSARVTIEIDGEPGFTGEVLLGKPKTISVPVTGVLRLSISYADPADDCEMGNLILGAPTLKR